MTLDIFANCLHLWMELWKKNFAFPEKTEENKKEQVQSPVEYFKAAVQHYVVFWTHLLASADSLYIFNRHTNMKYTKLSFTPVKMFAQKSHQTVIKYLVWYHLCHKFARIRPILFLLRMFYVVRVL